MKVLQGSLDPHNLSEGKVTSLTLKSKTGVIKNERGAGESGDTMLFYVDREKIMSIN